MRRAKLDFAKNQQNLTAYNDLIATIESLMVLPNSCFMFVEAMIVQSSEIRDDMDSIII